MEKGDNKSVVVGMKNELTDVFNRTVLSEVANGAAFLQIHS